VKLLFFPNRQTNSYASIGEDEVGAAATRRAEGTLSRRPGRKQQQERGGGGGGGVMEILTRRRLINTIAGLPSVALQSPVSSRSTRCCSRHHRKCATAPFYGWIQDCRAPDPTTLFNGFGCSFDPNRGGRCWDRISGARRRANLMGITIVVPDEAQPTPPAPRPQKMIFELDALNLHFMLAGPGGLVIYWAWNHLLRAAAEASSCAKTVTWKGELLGQYQGDVCQRSRFEDVNCAPSS